MSDKSIFGVEPGREGVSHSLRRLLASKREYCLGDEGG